MNAPAPVQTRQSASVGEAMHALIAELFPLCRSITGEGVRQTLAILGRHVPMQVHEVPSGTPCFDWQVPDEWNIRDAYVMDEAGNRVIDFQENNLHVVGYSMPFEGEMTLDALRPHLHTRPDLPDAIPYVTSYYERRWGFCLRDDDLHDLGPGPYRVKIDATLAPGSLTYGEILIPGDSSDEILLATNVCHPSMANNELSGPVLATFLAGWLLDLDHRHYTYRIVYVPETIGALAYLSRNVTVMKERTKAGFQVVCVGGDGGDDDDGDSGFTYLESRRGDTLADRAARHVLKHGDDDYRVLGFGHRASDERQWCSPGIDLPVGSLMRAKYHDYTQYHTSKDDLDFVKPEHMAASFVVYTRVLEALEQNRLYAGTLAGGEPNLGKRGLYPTLGGQSHEAADANLLLDILAHADGDHDLLAIAERLDRSIFALSAAVTVLLDEGLLRVVTSE